MYPVNHSKRQAQGDTTCPSLKSNKTMAMQSAVKSSIPLPHLHIQDTTSTQQLRPKQVSRPGRLRFPAVVSILLLALHGPLLVLLSAPWQAVSWCSNPWLLLPTPLARASSITSAQHDHPNPYPYSHGYSIEELRVHVRRRLAHLQEHATSSVLVHVHVPKTGGTAVSIALSSNCSCSLDSSGSKLHCSKCAQVFSRKKGENQSGHTRGRSRRGSERAVQEHFDYSVSRLTGWRCGVHAPLSVMRHCLGSELQPSARLTTTATTASSVTNSASTTRATTQSPPPTSSAGPEGGHYRLAESGFQAVFLLFLRSPFERFVSEALFWDQYTAPDWNVLIQHRQSHATTATSTATATATAAGPGSSSSSSSSSTAPHSYWETLPHVLIHPHLAPSQIAGPPAAVGMDHGEEEGEEHGQDETNPAAVTVRDYATLPAHLLLHNRQVKMLGGALEDFDMTFDHSTRLGSRWNPPALIAAASAATTDATPSSSSNSRSRNDTAISSTRSATKGAAVAALPSAAGRPWVEVSYSPGSAGSRYMSGVLRAASQALVEQPDVLVGLEERFAETLCILESMYGVAAPLGPGLVFDWDPLRNAHKASDGSYNISDADSKYNAFMETSSGGSNSGTNGGGSSVYYEWLTRNREDQALYETAVEVFDAQFQLTLERIRAASGLQGQAAASRHNQQPLKSNANADRVVLKGRPQSSQHSTSAQAFSSEHLPHCQPFLDAI